MSSGKYIGILDPVNLPEVKGWVYNSKNEEQPVRVSIQVNGEDVAEVVANQYRKQLQLKKGHPTGLCGFSYLIPDHLTIDCDTVSIRVIVKENGQSLVNSPQLVVGKAPVAKSGKRIFFMHIAKTAGTTVNHVLSSAFPKERVITHIESIDWKNTPITQLYDFISGHVRIKDVLKRHSLDDFQLITALRDPYKQLISHLRWLKYVGQDTQSDFFKSHSPQIQKVCYRLNEIDFSNYAELERYVQSFGKSEYILFHNCQTRYFLDNHHKLVLTEDDLSEALDTTDLFSVVGSNEHLSDFYQQIKNLGIDITVEDPPRLNVQKNTFGLNANSQEVKQILEPLYSIDQKLIEAIKVHTHE